MTLPTQKVANLRHKRFAHVSPKFIERTSKHEGVRSLPKLKNNSLYETCKLNKQKKISFKSIGYIKSKHLLKLLHLEVWGLSKVKDKNCERYFLAIIDEFFS